MVSSRVGQRLIHHSAGCLIDIYKLLDLVESYQFVLDISLFGIGAEQSLDEPLFVAHPFVVKNVSYNLTKLADCDRDHV